MFVRRIVRALRLSLLALAAFGWGGCVTPGPLRFDPPSPPLDFGFTGGDERPVHVVTPFARPIQPCPATQPPPGKGRPILLVASWQDFLACAEEPAPWLATQLAQALQAAGFRLVDAASLGEDGLRVEGGINQLVVEPNGTRLAPAALDLFVELHVTTASGLSARRRFFVKSIQGGNQRDASQKALDDAFRRAVHDMAAATLSLSNRFPPPPPALAETDTP